MFVVVLQDSRSHAESITVWNEFSLLTPVAAVDAEGYALIGYCPSVVQLVFWFELSHNISEDESPC